MALPAKLLEPDAAVDETAAAPRPRATPSRRVKRVPRSRAGSSRARVAWLLGIGLPLAAVNLIGLPYYRAPMAVRVRHPWHHLLRPSGTVGLAAGILALAIFVFLWLYPLRKKFKQLAFLGSVGRWMDVHVASALALPLLLLIHSAWQSDGLIGLGLVAMFVVIASGIVGRYLYVRIPRARDGVELTREEVATERRDLIDRLAATTGLPVDAVERTLDISGADAAEPGVARAILQLLAADLLRWRRTAQLRRRWMAMAPDGRPLGRPALREAVRLANREISLTQQSRMLQATHRIFRFWHVAHRPFAITALIAVIIHVAVVLAVGVVGF
jgi:hypothetical protein